MRPPNRGDVVATSASQLRSAVLFVKAW